jgi:phage baseplate assembly protein gpV
MGRSPPWRLPAMGEPGVVAGAGGVVVVEVVVTGVRGFSWNEPQPLRRAAARRENARWWMDDRVKGGSPECCK